MLCSKSFRLRLRARALVRGNATATTAPERGASSTRDALDAAYRTLLDVGDTQERVRITGAQAAAVQCAVDGYSVFLHLPTGAGKSLAFQAPALVAPPGKTTLVVSPLIALMHDQVNALRRKGVRAVQVSADDTRKRAAVPLVQLLANQRLVYTTPEFLLQNAEMQQWVRCVAEQDRIARVVLDEAHCVLEWGSTFRPAYLELSQWRTRFFSALPLTLATASVTDDEIAQLAAIFHLELVGSAAEAARSSDAASASSRLVVVQQVADRTNLRVEVVRKPQTASACARTIAHRVQHAPTVVYCLTRREAEDVCLALVRIGCHAGVYHGGLARKRREFVRKQWMGGQLSIMCATSAFGMGIDRADVRFVVHHSLPLSLTSYLQQIGRAGRDGAPAVCLLLYDEGDKSRASMVTTERDDADGAFVSTGSSHSDLEDMAAFCSTADCRRELLHAHFGFPFDASACARQCNCGPLAASATEDDEEHASESASDAAAASRHRAKLSHRGRSGAGEQVAKVQIEYLYQRVLAETKKRGLPKREALSRRVVQDILERQPATEDEMAALRGVGPDRARRLFSLFASR